MGNWLLIRLLANGFEQFSNQKLTIKMEGIIMVKRSFMVSLLLFASSSAFSCYDPAGSGQCGPNGIGPRNPNGYNNSVGGGTAYIPPYSSPVTIRKPDSFAALAQATSGRTFSVTHMHSTTEAKNSVIRKCEQSTGEKCIVAHAFRNGCMSAASGMLKSGGYRLFPVSAPTGQEAERKAMAACEAAGLHDCLLTFEVPACSFS